MSILFQISKMALLLDTNSGENPLFFFTPGWTCRPRSS